MTALMEAPVFAPPRRAGLKTAAVPVPSEFIGKPKAMTATVPVPSPAAPSSSSRPVMILPKQQSAPSEIPAAGLDAGSALWKANPHLRTLGVRERTAPAKRTPPAAVLDLSVLPSAEELRSWVDGSGDGHLRFARSGGATIGNLEVSECAFFDGDYACLMDAAAALASALGLSSATVASIAEPARAVCYWRLSEGYAGTYAAAGTTIAGILGV